ncbi:ASCH domain-containing protein, partial [Bacillus altitudinis]|nr:ASCH domain-containing protein [Bacillus altitudinis]
LFYEKEQEPLPKPGQYAVILDSQEEPKAIIEITQVDIMPMNEVPESFAKAEGEGDLSYDYWYKEHEEFFTEALEPYGLTFKEDMLLVCERFKLVYSAS